MCLQVSYKKKNEGKITFLASLKSLKKGVRSGSVSQRYGSGSASKCHGSPTLLHSEEMLNKLSLFSVPFS
jgi:hypothetical protein